MMVIQEEEFSSYIKQYERLIITICLSFTKSYFDAEDLAQQTFLSAYTNYSKFDGVNFKAWITRIAINKCKDFLKSPARVIYSLSDENFECLKDKGGTPEDMLLERCSKKKIHNLCERLKEPYRSVAVNYFCEAIKLSDMAKDTGISLKTLQTHLYRSKKLLKNLWKEEFM
ncbi:sigma-70 family RNA polymerase sigma factor [Clostridium estertheticum]|uniref:RNA polymerase sigma factor n=1 Tax=Clostridium estertheticum TaxID=238834 RepID=UPI001C0C01B8|nr:sigma-70 family RNA polymerase sigma factor [Clostridium estertheticum]MBU3216284.1 sigma-70 family RNA polymerase sigma factor [Clostridium estertheticum]MCB2306859.1 sigma-70 family RNA polymerase sigma factor [Clostridium estertheticum]MCB2345352.1 sigma-70 family RNA polymerase sigma factor [Clostridium estertheticum]MCB2350365.1 sigma-70 family RNA polymerase sigma factor [Clostridium estertheticum]WAG45237.1 sigma-70 family RNA polymerase sigma factor [Clostridium estertheticum]